MVECIFFYSQKVLLSFLIVIFQNQIRRIQDEIDRTESKLETMTTNEGGRKRGKKDDPKKSDKEVIFSELFY